MVHVPVPLHPPPLQPPNAEVAAGVAVSVTGASRAERACRCRRS